jgi:hypothetical protein
MIHVAEGMRGSALLIGLTRPLTRAAAPRP